MAQPDRNGGGVLPASERVADPHIPDPAALGALVRRVRREQGLTLEALYEVSGLTTRFLSEFERGKANVSLGRAMDALAALGLTMLVLPREQAERLLSQRQTVSEPDSEGAEQ